MGRTPLVIKAPAKINLGLAVHGRRADGYHTLETVLQTVSLADTLTFMARRKPGLSFRCTLPELETEDNLVYRAAAALKKEAGATLPGVEITLFKTIPGATGLGGGSSDAAATLVALNHFWGLGRDRETLACLGAEIGSDVPFFLYGPTALARGRGEIVNPLPPLPFFWVILALPEGLSLSTAAVYRTLPAPLPPPLDLKPLLRALCSGDRGRVLQWLARGETNTLAEAVLPRYPEVRDLLSILAGLGLPAALSGSGPAVFALTTSRRKALTASRRLQEEGRRAYLCWVGGSSLWPLYQDCFQGEKGNRDERIIPASNFSGK